MGRVLKYALLISCLVSGRGDAEQMPVSFDTPYPPTLLSTVYRFARQFFDELRMIAEGHSYDEDEKGLSLLVDHALHFYIATSVLACKGKEDRYVFEDIVHLYELITRVQEHLDDLFEKHASPEQGCLFIVIDRTKKKVEQMLQKMQNHTLPQDYYNDL